MNENLMAALEIMGSGMFALFIVMIIVALSVVILNRADNRNNNK
jgi:hypothetical protein